jgi:hypothetical protein
MNPLLLQRFQQGLAIPACPLAVTSERLLDERRQRALVRYYLAAGAGGLAVGVHTTQFAIRAAGLLKRVLALCREELNADKSRISIAGICGPTIQAVVEASLAIELGYDAGLLSLAAFKNEDEEQLLRHCRQVARVLPIIGFYLQPAVGGRVHSYHFWRKFAEIPEVIGIKIAPFNRYQTLDVVRAVIDSGRADVALYTGNDDNIVLDLLAPFQGEANGKKIQRRIVGGLLGHWAVWTERAVQYQKKLREAAETGGPIDQQWLRFAIEVTDANAAFFDAANGFAGCIAGLHEVLRRQGLFEGIWCLDPSERLSPGQSAEIDRVCRAYPHLKDDDFVAAHLAEWLS